VENPLPATVKPGESFERHDVKYQLPRDPATRTAAAVQDRHGAGYNKMMHEAKKEIPYFDAVTAPHFSCSNVFRQTKTVKIFCIVDGLLYFCRRFWCNRVAIAGG
jgi:hypothetical protein